MNKLTDILMALALLLMVALVGVTVFKVTTAECPDPATVPAEVV